MRPETGQYQERFVAGVSDALEVSVLRGMGPVVSEMFA
jgi:hypothetical protein